MTWNPGKTATEFAAEYASRANMTVDALRGYGREPRPCDCGEDGCEGWMMVNAAEHDADLTAWRAGRAPHPGRLSADDQTRVDHDAT